jgi:hypothetical protein
MNHHERLHEVVFIIGGTLLNDANQMFALVLVLSLYVSSLTADSVTGNSLFMLYLKMFRSISSARGAAGCSILEQSTFVRGEAISTVQ